MALPSLDEYSAWAAENIGFRSKDEQFKRRYAQNTTSIRASVESSEQWAKLVTIFDELAAAYAAENGVSLFTEGGWKPVLKAKPFDSVVEKMYRVNILQNRSFPGPPFEGEQYPWLVEENLFAKLDDLIRCRVVARYMDGPQYICDAAAQKLGNEIVSKQRSMETELGYYAWHLGVKVPSTVVRPNGKIEDETVMVEVQLTTHLNDVLNDLTHSFYENRRVTQGSSESLWKWQPHNPQFKGAFFGHTLHLLEGMIVELKNEITKKKD